MNSTTLSICNRRWQHRANRSAAENRDVARAGAIVIAVEVEVEVEVEVARQEAAKKMSRGKRIIRAVRCRAVARAGPSAARQWHRASDAAVAKAEGVRAADDQAVARDDRVAAPDDRTAADDRAEALENRVLLVASL